MTSFKKTPQTLANRQFSKIISRLANGKVYIYILANCQVGDFTILKVIKLNFTLTLFDSVQLLLLKFLTKIYFMKELLNNALEQLKIARIHVNPRSLRKQISLFEIDDSHDVEFNGSKSTGTYQQHLYSFYLPCKRQVDEMMNDSLDKADSVKREFDLYCFEIREFKHLFFPKDFVNVLLNRIEFHKSIPRELVNSEAIKKNSGLFYCPVPNA